MSFVNDCLAVNSPTCDWSTTLWDAPESHPDRKVLSDPTAVDGRILFFLIFWHPMQLCLLSLLFIWSAMTRFNAWLQGILFLVSCPDRITLSKIWQSLQRLDPIWSSGFQTGNNWPTEKVYIMYYSSFPECCNSHSLPECSVILCKLTSITQWHIQTFPSVFESTCNKIVHILFAFHYKPLQAVMSLHVAEVSQLFSFFYGVNEPVFLIDYLGY